MYGIIRGWDTNRLRECDEERVEEGEQGGERGRKRRTCVDNTEKTVKPDTVPIRLDDREGRERQSSLTSTLANARYKSGEDLATDRQGTLTAEREGDHREWASSYRRHHGR